MTASPALAYRPVENQPRRMVLMLRVTLSGCGREPIGKGEERKRIDILERNRMSKAKKGNKRMMITEERKQKEKNREEAGNYAMTSSASPAALAFGGVEYIETDVD